MTNQILAWFYSLQDQIVVWLYWHPFIVTLLFFGALAEVAAMFGMPVYRLCLWPFCRVRPWPPEDYDSFPYGGIPLSVLPRPDIAALFLGRSKSDWAATKRKVAAALLLVRRFFSISSICRALRQLWVARATLLHGLASEWARYRNTWVDPGDYLDRNPGWLVRWFLARMARWIRLARSWLGVTVGVVVGDDEGSGSSADLLTIWHSLEAHVHSLMLDARCAWIVPSVRHTVGGYAFRCRECHPRLLLCLEPLSGPPGHRCRSALDHEITHGLQDLLGGVLGDHCSCRGRPGPLKAFRRSSLEFHAHLTGSPLFGWPILLVFLTFFLYVYAKVSP